MFGLVHQLGQTILRDFNATALMISWIAYDAENKCLDWDNLIADG